MLFLWLQIEIWLELVCLCMSLGFVSVIFSVADRDIQIHSSCCLSLASTSVSWPRVLPFYFHFRCWYRGSLRKYLLVDTSLLALSAFVHWLHCNVREEGKNDLHFCTTFQPGILRHLQHPNKQFLINAHEMIGNTLCHDWESWRCGRVWFGMKI